jgi:hypothetical protein
MSAPIALIAMLTIPKSTVPSTTAKASAMIVKSTAATVMPTIVEPLGSGGPDFVGGS